MGLFDRISRVVRANVNDMVSKAEDPEKMLEQAVTDMNEDLVQLRQAVAKAIAAERRSRSQYEEQQQEAEKWQERAQLALNKGDEDLARQALQRKKSAADAAAQLKPQVEQQKSQVETLKKSLTALEGKISEAKTKKEMLGARMKAAKANEQLQEQVGNMNSSSAASAFDRMEEKVMEMEASGEAAAELAGDQNSIENQFAQLESGSDVDDELAAMKAQLSGSSQNQQALPESDQQSSGQPKPTQTQNTAGDEVTDAELEALRKQLDS